MEASELCAQAEQEALAWALEEGFGLAAQHWVMVLGNRGEIIGLQDLLTALRKHFKMLRSAPAVMHDLSMNGFKTLHGCPVKSCFGPCSVGFAHVHATSAAQYL